MTKLRPLNRCLECANAFSADAPPEKEFCGQLCRHSFHRRAEKRAVQVYHLFMATRFERDLSKKLDLWTKLCRLVMHHRWEDKKYRKGRASWTRPEKVIAGIPVATLSGVYGEA